MKIRPIKAYAIVKNNKLNALEIFKDTDFVITKGEEVIEVLITPVRTVKIKKNKRV